MDEVQLEPKPRKNATWWKKLRYSYRSIPDKKQYIEFFTALLSVPVLLTVILLNINNLRAKDTATTPTPVPTQKEQIIYVSPPSDSSKTSQAVSPSGTQCKQNLPPVTIQYPNEGDTIQDNPLNISITYPKDSNYCAIVWSYRINNASWSDFDNNSISLYNLSSGKVIFDLRVKSIVTGEGMTIRRTFQYVNPNVTPDNTSSNSATTH